MRNYENYTPEINYGGELPSIDKNIDEALKGQERTRRRRKSEKKPTSKKPEPRRENTLPLFQRIKNALTSTQSKLLFGIFFGCLTVYFAVSFFSYFSTCIQDQAKIAEVPVGQSVNISNPGGEGGARLSEIVINQGFGLGSFVIIFWLGALTLKLLIGKPRFKTVDFTIKCLVALITVSLIIGLVTFNFHTKVNWGGYHGTYVNEFIINFVGNMGAVLLSLFMIALFIVICLRDLVNWILRIRQKRAERKRIEREEREARKVKEELIRKMQMQEQIDDLRAGETAVINGGDITDVNEEDEQVKFEDDNSLYDLSQSDEPMKAEVEDIDDIRTDETDFATDSQEAELNDKNVADRSTENTSENFDENDKNESDDSSVENTDSTSSKSMVVNVNSIGQTSSNRFRSDIEIFENQKYKFPPFNLLIEGQTKVTLDENEQIENKHRIEQTLLDFGIPITSIEATVGPTVTLYEIVPETGVKIAKIRSLVDEIALNLSAKGVRIIAPIPGKGTVGIEVANKDPQTVSMRTVIKSRKYQDTKYHLPIALGSTIQNEVYIADLAKMPHLLVAGATGQGKSVGLNAIIASLLYCKAPHEIKFVMIDPKQVEFSLYNKLKNYYMAQIPGGDEEVVITDMDKVEATLNSLCIEMENRYKLLKNAHARNIEEYNTKIRENQLNPKDGHKFLPYIVVIVDEFGDLIMVKGKNVEMPIARLAQKARAVGMHVIIATQRPSTNVITGIIKANFPARISFKVSSGVDSKTILDTPGAQQLIGRGDMLIFNNSEMVRVQCAFIDTPEVEAICDYVERQPYPQGIYELPEPVIEGGDAMVEKTPLSDKDPLLPDVARAVVNSGKASTSSVQRHYEIGYNRAGRIMDQLERLGVVGPSQGGKPRTVLVDPMRLEEILGELD